MSVTPSSRDQKWSFVCEKFALAAEIDDLIVSATFKDPDAVNLLRRYRGKILGSQCREELENLQDRFAQRLLGNCDNLKDEIENHFQNR